MSDGERQVFTAAELHADPAAVIRASRGHRLALTAALKGDS